MLCCDWLCRVVFFCFAVVVDDCCLDLVLDYVVVGYVKLVCVCVLLLMICV